MKTLLLLWVLLGVGAVDAPAQSDYAPKSGSKERQGICDAARAFVLKKYAFAPLPQPIVFKIDHIRVRNGYCNVEAIPLFKDGSYVSPKYMPDIAFNFCLKKTGETWQIIADLSRTDVPDPAELQHLKQNFPRDFPVSLLSSTWRDLFNRSP
jgi:hypothetical protein